MGWDAGGRARYGGAAPCGAERCSSAVGGARAAAALRSAAGFRTANGFFFPFVLYAFSGFPSSSWIRRSGLVPVLPQLWLIVGFPLRGSLPQCERQRRGGLRSAPRDRDPREDKAQPGSAAWGRCGAPRGALLLRFLWRGGARGSGRDRSLLYSGGGVILRMGTRRWGGGCSFMALSHGS